MPRFTLPPLEKGESRKPATVFEEVAAVIREVGPEDIINLHLGDTHTLPPVPARPTRLDLKKWPGFGQYCDTQGIPPLKELLVEKLHKKNRMGWVETPHIQITCGAIHALYATFSVLLDPGEEVLVLSPHWHLTNSVIEQAGGVPRDTDFYVPLGEDPGCDVPALLKAGLSSRTVALYLNTPCNPTGKILNRSILEQIAEFACEHDLWVVSDEAYEDFLYTGEEHVSIATLREMGHRTVSIFTFSKCLAAAGYRVGYAVANPEIIHKIHRAGTQTVYNAPTNNQYLVVQALLTWNEWFPELYRRYKANRDLVCDRFKGRFFMPEGSFYVFFDAREIIKGKDSKVLLQDMVRQGVAAVPGHAFGRGYEEWFRFCFVAVPEERLAQGIDRLNRVVGRA